MNFFVGDQVPNVVAMTHQPIPRIASELLLHHLLDVTLTTNVHPHHKTEHLIKIQVTRYRILPTEHDLYSYIFYVILTNLFSLLFVVLQNSRNSASIFFVSDLTSGDSVFANFSTTAIHTATQHNSSQVKKMTKQYSQNTYNCTEPRENF